SRDSASLARRAGSAASARPFRRPRYPSTSRPGCSAAAMRGAARASGISRSGRRTTAVNSASEGSLSINNRGRGGFPRCAAPPPAAPRPGPAGGRPPAAGPPAPPRPAPPRPLRFRARRQLEQEGATELVMEALVRLDHIAVEPGGDPVARTIAELDELAVLHHRDGLAGELAGGHPLHGGLERVEVLEQRPEALGERIEAARVEAQLSQPVRDHPVVLGLVAGLPREGHLHLDIARAHH